MKKTLAIILTALMILPLLSCGKKPEQQAGDPVPSGTIAPDVTSAPDNSGNDLAATDKPSVTVDTSYNPETDADNLYSAAQSCLIETEDGFYWSSSGNYYLLFYDEGLEEMIPVCSRPECEHFPDNNVCVQNKKCDAYLEAVRHPALYNGKLYYIDMNGAANPNIDGTRLGMRLFRMNPDGTGKEFIKNLFTPGYEEPDWLIFHRGYIYGIGQEMKVSQGDVDEKTAVLAIPIEGDETTFRRIYEMDNKGWGCMRFIGDYCYFWFDYEEGEYYVNYQTGEEIDETQSGGVAGRWNSKTEETEILYQSPELLPKGEYFGSTAWVERDGTIYVTGSSGLMKIENGELSVICNFEEEGKNFVAPTVSNGIAFARTVPKSFDDPYGKFEFWVRRFDGSTVFKGELPMDWFYESPEFEGLRGEPNCPAFSMIVGDETGLWIEFCCDWRSTGRNEPSASYLIRYDFTEDGGIEYKLYGSYVDDPPEYVDD
ncbi:MAG: hypothetical protein J5544_03865 [Clostridia bacterium]|nr:hypothetical protein [Clostridia bacterium]